MLARQVAVFAPASCSCRTAMICSSVSLTRFIVRPCNGLRPCLPPPRPLDTHATLAIGFIRLSALRSAGSSRNSSVARSNALRKDIVRVNGQDSPADGYGIYRRFAGQVFGDGARVNFHTRPGGTPCGRHLGVRLGKRLQQPVEDALKTTLQRAPSFFITLDIPEGELPV